MRISVCIPTYCAEAFISEALTSVSAQSLAAWEVLIYEDGTKDRTEEFATSHSQRFNLPVRYLCGPDNLGVSHARNILLREACGTHIAWLDADDTWRPDHLQELARCNVDIAVSDVEVFDSISGDILHYPSDSNFLLEDPVGCLIRRSTIVTTSSVMMRTSLRESVGLFDPSLTIGEDRDYWLRAALDGALFGFSPHRSCRYRKHQTSLMNKTVRVADDAVYFYRKHLASAPMQFRNLLRQQLSAALNIRGRLIRASDPERALESFAESLLLNPADSKTAMQWAFTRLVLFLHSK